MRLQASFQSLLEKSIFKNKTPLQFSVNQIFHGKVSKLFPGSFAEIKLGEQKMIAKLEVPLVNGKGYWFQVISNDSEVKLRMLPTKLENNNGLLQYMNIPNTKTNKALLRFLQEHNIPLSKNDIAQISHLLTLSKDMEKSLQVVRMMHTHNMAFNEKIFLSLLSANKDISFTNLLASLQDALLVERNKTDSSHKLLTHLEVMRTNNVLSGNSNLELAQMLKIAHNQTGAFYEANVLHNELNKESIQHSLKPLLVQLLQDDSISMKTREIVEQMLYRMNGMQIVSNDSNGFQQLMYEVPINLAGHKTDLTMQWSGKKTKAGTISADFCRIIFYLDLQYVHETIVDMQVQNRIVTVNIFNENEHIKALAQPFIEPLQTGLKAIGYQLATVHFSGSQINNSKKEKKFMSVHQPYSGVDIRI